MKIIYVHDATTNEIEVLGEIVTNHSMTVEQALEIAGIDMDEYASSNGWEGYNPLAISLEY